MRSMILGVMSLALISCNERQTSHDATMAIAEDVISPFKDKGANLKERLAALEVDLRAQETYSKAVHAALDKERENLVKDLNALRDHYNDRFSRFHGAP
jgi:hypothetical protein